MRVSCARCLAASPLTFRSIGEGFLTSWQGAMETKEHRAHAGEVQSVNAKRKIVPIEFFIYGVACVLSSTADTVLDAPTLL